MLWSFGTLLRSYFSLFVLRTCVLLEHDTLEQILTQALTVPEALTTASPSSAYLARHNQHLSTLFSSVTLRKRLKFEMDCGHPVSFFLTMLSLAVSNVDTEQPYLTQEHIM